MLCSILRIGTAHAIEFGDASQEAKPLDPWRAMITMSESSRVIGFPGLQRAAFHVAACCRTVPSFLPARPLEGRLRISAASPPRLRPVSSKIIARWTNWAMAAVVIMQLRRSVRQGS